MPDEKARELDEAIERVRRARQHARPYIAAQGPEPTRYYCAEVRTVDADTICSAAQAYATLRAGVETLAETYEVLTGQSPLRSNGYDQACRDTAERLRALLDDSERAK